MNDTRKGRSKAMALFAVAIMLVMSIFPMLSAEDSDGELPYYSYTINTNAEVISGTYSPIGSTSTGSYVSSNGENVGSWGFDSDGYGPFNSFYAAFDPAQNNRMICHLDPNDLTRSVNGDSIAGLGYNIMWCLPTVYWSTDASGNLILSNDPSKGTAYAHTINGRIFNYLAIGVYEASTASIDGTTILTSTSGDIPTTQLKSKISSYARNQLVNTNYESDNNGFAMLWNFYQWELYKYCALTVMGSWDSQGVAGNGASYTSSWRTDYYVTPGMLDAAGPYAGTRGSSTSSKYTTDPVKVFIENAWGSCWEYVDGLTIKDNGFFYVDSSSVPKESTAGGVNVVVYDPVLPSSFGYGSVPSTIDGVWGMPTENGGTSTSGSYDYIDPVDTSEIYSVLVVGGNRYTSLSNAAKAGLNCTDNFFSDYGLGAYTGRLAFVYDPQPVQSHEVTFSSNGSIIDTQVIDSGTTAATFNPTLDGYTFKGWYTDNTFSTPFDFATPITSDITLFAKWEGNFAFTSEPTAAGNVKVLSSMDGTVVFDASASNGSLIVWDFGDGTTAIGMYQTHYYSQPGNYTVKLMVYNDNEKMDLKEYNVSIPDPSLESLGRGILPTIAIALVLIIGGGLVVRHLL